MRPFCIYGAGIVAAGIYTALRETHGCVPEAFLVAGREGNPSEIDGIPVRPFSEWAPLNGEMLYLVAAPETHHREIAGLLHKKGIDDGQIVFIDNSLENRVMGEYYGRHSQLVTARQILKSKVTDAGMEKPDIKVFQAKCHTDRALMGAYRMPDYVCPIQAGAALADRVVLDMRDNEGENISAKNGNYCELTAGYHAWKHSHADYKGLCHYRRIFDVSDGQMRELLKRNAEWDVILPYPSVHYPDISGQHLRYIRQVDWDAMVQALKETAPEYYNKFEHVFCGQFFYNFNMLVAKREVFDDYCSFLFSVLGRTEELTTPKGWERADRFAGYLGENLTTLYFMANKDRLKIIHAGKIWLT